MSKRIVTQIKSILRYLAAAGAVTLVSCVQSSQAPAEKIPASPPPAVPPPIVQEREPKLPALYASPVALMPNAVTSFGAAATPAHVYTLGGYFGIAHQYSKEGQSDRFERMNLETKEWETLPSPGALQSATLTEFDGKLYRVGGLRIHNAEGEATEMESVNAVERFDPAQGVWQSLTPLPTPRSSHAAVRAGSELFVVGGWRLQGDASSGTWDDVAYVADLTEEPLVWRSIPVPFRLRALGAAVDDRRLVTVGGIGNSAASREVHIYDFETRQWTKGPEYPEPGFGVAAVGIERRVLASGSSGHVYTLEMQEKRWVPQATLAFPRAFHQLVTTQPNAVLALGGIAGMRRVDRIRHVEQLSFGEKPEPVTRWVLEAPGGAKNRQGLFLRGRQLYAFGGNNSLGQHDFGPENFLAEGHHLDLGSLSWKRWVDFPKPQQSMQTLVTNDGVGVAVGGFGLTPTGLQTSTEMYLFDFDEQTWSKPLPGLSPSRTQFGLYEHGASLWVFGGLNFDDAREGQAKFVHPREVLSLDKKNPENGFRPAGFEIPRPRRAFAGAGMGDKYYLIGGMAAGFAPVEECDVFDFSTQSWSTIAAPRQVRIGAELAALNGKLYLAAGRSPGADGKLGPNNSIEVFDPEQNTWTMWIEQLPMKDTHQLRMFGLDERLLVYSAQRADEKIEILLIDPSR